ncbi:hypothetical protein A7K69_14820 [Parageobacillus thermoglucosidasius]|uniref:Uncharacterized protein n=1 Tax=Parageobacillus thermoglucosidasius TaxID=1426 RepID=A0A1B7KMN6_PARTM|nr:hypothetical protein A7K69_14820 [Parageobacillus thermoglucosidasius]
MPPRFVCPPYFFRFIASWRQRRSAKTPPQPKQVKRHHTRKHHRKIFFDVDAKEDDLHAIKQNEKRRD